MGIYGEGIATWDLRVVFDVDYLPLMALRSLKLLLPLFNAMLSSSSSKSSGRAIIKYGLWIPELLSDSPSVSEMQIRGALGLFPSSKWNLSISSSSDKRDEATPSTGIVTASRGAYRSRSVTGGGFCSAGRKTGGRSLWANGLETSIRANGLETSIQANLELPALIAWPTSWKVRGKGSQSKIRGAARNCPSSLTNISNLKR